jgi:hypothetical protein
MEENIDLKIKALQSAIDRSKSVYLKRDLRKKLWKLKRQKRREARKKKSD